MTRIYWTDARTGSTNWWITITRYGRVTGSGPLVATGRDDADELTVTYRCETSGKLRTVTYGGGQ